MMLTQMETRYVHVVIPPTQIVHNYKILLREQGWHMMKETGQRPWVARGYL